MPRGNYSEVQSVERLGLSTYVVLEVCRRKIKNRGLFVKTTSEKQEPYNIDDAKRFVGRHRGELSQKSETMRRGLR